MAIQIRVSVHSEDIAKCELLRLAQMVANEISDGYPSVTYPELDYEECGKGHKFVITHKLIYDFSP